MSPVLGDWRIQINWFESWSSQNKVLTIYTCHFLAMCSSLIGYCKDWLAQCQDNVTSGDDTGLAVGQHYKVAMNVHCPNLTLDVAKM